MTENTKRKNKGINKKIPRHLVRLTDEQWEAIKPLIPKNKPSRLGGRPPADNRETLEGILWILRTGAQWQYLPPEYPNPSTCWRRLRDWQKQGIWLKVWRTLLGQLDEQGKLDWAEAAIDGTFAPAKKGGKKVGKTKKGKGTKIMVAVDGNGIPIGVKIESATPAEIRLLESTLNTIRVPRKRGRPRSKPERVLGDRAYDSDPHRKKLKRRGIDLIVPHRKNRKKKDARWSQTATL
jgi:transposase